jgi:putative transcriptional regulator
MEIKDPMTELLSSLEQIVLTRDGKPCVSEIRIKEEFIPEPQRLREMTGMQVDEFAKVMGVSVSAVKKWEARRTRPSATAQKLMQLLHTNPYLGRQLLNQK